MFMALNTGNCKYSGKREEEEEDAITRRVRGERKENFGPSFSPFLSSPEALCPFADVHRISLSFLEFLGPCFTDLLRK